MSYGGAKVKGHRRGDGKLRKEYEKKRVKRGGAKLRRGVKYDERCGGEEGDGGGGGWNKERRGVERPPPLFFAIFQTLGKIMARGFWLFGIRLSVFFFFFVPPPARRIFFPC